MAVLKAGKAYLVLDPIHPPERLAARLADLQVRLLVTSQDYAPLATRIVPAGSRLLQGERLTVTPASAQNLGMIPLANDAAGLFSTSGTTGEPKTVARKHNTLLHRVWLETSEEQFHTNDSAIVNSRLRDGRRVFKGKLCKHKVHQVSPRIEPLIAS